MKNQFINTGLAALLLCAAAYGQNPQKDPLKNGEQGSPAEAAGNPSPNLAIRYETFSLGLADAAALTRENPRDSELYAKLVAMIAKKEAKQEALVLLRSKSGQKATAESISEQTYVTEYEPPELPEAVGASFITRKGPEIKNPDGTTARQPAQMPNAAALEDAPSVSELSGLATPASPSSFQARNVGDTLEIEPILSEDNRLIDLRLVPERITRTGNSTWGQGLSKVEMPEFESQRVNTSATLEIGKPFLVGTVNRPPVSKEDGDSANRIWFAFVTANFAK
ncbi:hypothetical protein KBB96_07755 [Luteolibacter ambystomatis]|uniref:Uncharacterized protein n=1 Tax=Luteolibacter ambystomatis TaxID=2824561 RepID=A0A975J2D8_9BACT|nr:hypothetical protein [Luteolibacter ambystomatis]QUE52777.1 hypothetical protein KBB96_07755 [Luteolibacter ambystomatis]